MQKRVILLTAELAALIILRIIFVLGKPKKLPLGAKVRAIRNRPVLKSMLPNKNRNKEIPVVTASLQPPEEERRVEE